MSGATREKTKSFSREKLKPLREIRFWGENTFGNKLISKRMIGPLVVSVSL